MKKKLNLIILFFAPYILHSQEVAIRTAIEKLISKIEIIGDIITGLIIVVLLIVGGVKYSTTEEMERKKILVSIFWQIVILVLFVQGAVFMSKFFIIT